MSSRWLIAAVVTLLPAFGGVAVSGQRADPPSTARGEWPTYGGDLASSKYSPLDQITAANFGRLDHDFRVDRGAVLDDRRGIFHRFPH
ncbi:MAG: hypothetical protein ACREKH_14750 [Candidatus Rokuibacteriota bacterium]